LVSIIAESSVRNVVYDINTAACANKRISAPAGLTMQGASNTGQDIVSPNGVLAQIDTQLNQKNPVAIMYGSIALRDRHSPYMWAADHASIIVGRKWNPVTHDCDYLIRNSWGKGDSRYDSFYQSEAGNIWVPKEEIFKSVAAIDYLQSQ
jgi:hypothetical protein